MTNLVTPALASSVTGMRPFTLRSALFPPPGQPPTIRSTRRDGRLLVDLAEVIALAVKSDRQEVRR